jgi:membrane protease YdiL (CAAX protease family)
MGDNASLLRLDDQPPVIQLLVSLLFTVVTGTIFFWLFIYLGSLIFATPAADMMRIPEPGAGGRQITILRYVQSSQQIGLFLVPAVLLSILLGKAGESFLKIRRSPELLSVILTIVLIIFIIPVIAWTGILNSGMDLPGRFAGLERILHEKESRASDIMGFLIVSNGILMLALNILILAVIPAFAEELLFRGILQQLLSGFFRSAHTGIWITAIIFSAVHFQFYGFLPRMLLGLLFGYLFFWTGNLWSAIIPHFLNNAVPVIMTFLLSKGNGLKQVSGDAGVFPFVQAILAALVLYYIWNISRKKLIS